MAAMAGRSPPTPPPPSTTGMTPRKDTIDAFPHAPSAPHPSLTPAPPAPSLELPKDDVVSIVSGSVRRLVRDSMVQDANDHASLAARSVASSVCTNLQDIAQWWATNGENESQEHDSDDQSDDDSDKPDIVPTPSASAIPIATDAHSATMNAPRRGSTDSSTRPSAPQQQHISPLASPRASPMTSRRSSVDQTAGTKQHNVDSVRRVLQATWNSHRLSDHGSVSSRSTVSHKSPPGSINPRQLNQHLASLAIQNHQAYQSRPSLPAVFGPTAHHTDDIIFQGPAPTVSFSSSTVRTMIPENETVEAPVRPATTSTKKKPGNDASAANPQKSTKPSANNTAAPPTKQNPAKQPPSSSSAAPKKDYSKSFGTMRTGRQQRASLPWQPAATSAPGNDKTPAQKERDRYLQSLKG
ncbi:hypothetical protein BC940DRAFT_298603 [Gongronella butleri]|nr:hypothetical protein BC940DRAFT_298603 [Gongronella butleri]